MENLVLSRKSMDEDRLFRLMGRAAWSGRRPVHSNLCLGFMKDGEGFARDGQCLVESETGADCLASAQVSLMV